MPADASAPPSVPPSSPPTASTRLVGLDIARITAIVLVVLLHACVAYMERPIAGLLWPVQESPGDTGWVDRVFLVVRALGVPTVTLIAGFFAARLVDKVGVRGFLVERARRLGLPLLLGMVLILPAMYLVWAWGWVERDWAEPSHILHVRFGPAVQPNLFGLAHLWYVQYLLLYAFVYAAWCAIVPRRKSDAMGFASFLLALPGVRVVVLALPLWLILTQWPGVLRDFQNGFFPQPGKLLWNGVFFAGGIVLAQAARWSMGASNDLMTSLARILRGWWIDLALVVFASMHLWRLDPVNEGTLPRFAIAGAALAAAGGVGVLALGVAIGQLVVPTSRLAHTLTTLASATFWIYVLHLFFEGLTSVLLYKHELPIAVKLAIVLAAGLLGPLACFALARRWTWCAWMRPVSERARIAAPATVP